MFMFSQCWFPGLVYHHGRELNYVLETFILILSLKLELRQLPDTKEVSKICEMSLIHKGYHKKSRYMVSWQVVVASVVLLVDLKALMDNLNSCSIKISCILFKRVVVRQMHKLKKIILILLKGSITSHSNCSMLQILQGSLQFCIYPEAGVDNGSDQNKQICFLFSMFYFLMVMQGHWTTGTGFPQRTTKVIFLLLLWNIKMHLL